MRKTAKLVTDSAPKSLAPRMAKTTTRQIIKGTDKQPVSGVTKTSRITAPDTGMSYGPEKTKPVTESTTKLKKAKETKFGLKSKTGRFQFSSTYNIPPS